MAHTENSTCPPNLCFFKTWITRLTIKYKGFGAYIKVMSRLNKGAGVSKFHGQLKKKKKHLWRFQPCLVLKFNQEIRLQSCLQTRFCEKSYLFCKPKFQMKKMSVKHKTQQQISWGKSQRSTTSTVCIDPSWGPMSFLWKWLVNFPLFGCQQADYLTIRCHTTCNCKFLPMLKLLISPGETVSLFIVLQ